MLFIEPIHSLVIALSFTLVFVVIMLKVSKKAKQFEFRIELETKADSDSARAFIESVMGDKRTSLKGESLSNFELYWMHWRLSRDMPGCIDCEEGDLIPGPSAGININLKCSNNLCGSEFNACFIGIHGPFDRISNRSPKAPRKMVSFGPHR